MLRHENKWKQESISRNQDWAESSGDEPERERYFRQEQLRVEKEAAVYQKAYDAAKADAERLCPGRTFEAATGIKSLGRQDTVTSIQRQKEALDYLQRELARTKTWASHLPDSAVGTKEKVHYAVQEFERSITSAQESLKRQEDWLAEHGNTD